MRKDAPCFSLTLSNARCSLIVNRRLLRRLPINGLRTLFVPADRAVRPAVRDPKARVLYALLLILFLLIPAGSVPAADHDKEADKPAPEVPQRAASIEQALQGMRNQGSIFLRTSYAIEQMGYDSNLFNDEEDEIGTFTMTLAPELMVLLPVGAHQLFQASGKLGLVFFSESPPGNYLNAFGGVSYDLYRKRVHFSLGDYYVRDRRRFNTEFDQRILMTSNEANTVLAVRVANRVETGLNYRLNTIRYDSGSEMEDQPGLSLSEALDRDDYTAGWRSRFDFSSLAIGQFDLNRADYRFMMPSNIRESFEWSATAGVEIDEQAVISGLAQIGYTIFEGTEVEGQDFSGFLWNAAVTWQMSQRFHLLLESRRDRVFSTYAENIYFLNELYQPTIRVHLRELTWFGLGYTWSNSTYPVEDVNIGTPEDPLFVAREDDITGPVLTFQHQTGKLAGHTWTMGLEARYLTRESNAVNGYERFFVYLSFQVEQ